MLKLALIYIILVFILFIIFKLLFKLASPLKTLGLSIIVSIILFSTLNYIMYINDIDYELLGTSKEYITGEVVSKNGKTLSVRIIDHNLDNGINRNDRVNVRVTTSTALRHQTKMLFEHSITYNDIKIGDKVNVICDENKNDITAQKVVVKSIK